VREKGCDRAHGQAGYIAKAMFAAEANSFMTTFSV
jgi:hypothetical protein